MSNNFIVGMSRAGTTWVGKCLNEHPDVAVFGESLFWGRSYIEPANNNGTYTSEQVEEILEDLKSKACAAFLGNAPGDLKHIDNAKFPKLVSELQSELTLTPTPAEIFTKLAQKIAKTESKSIAIEKTPHHIHWLSRITSHLPQSRFLIMVRDPYGFMLSYKHQGDRQPASLRRQFKKLYHPIICAYLWRGYFRSSMAASYDYPNNSLLVFTDEMKKNPSETLLKIQKFFSLDLVSDLALRVPPDNSSFPDGKRPTLEEVDIFWMNLIAAKEIKEFGFTRQNAKFEIVEIIKSILKLPVWAIWTSYHLYRSTQGSTFNYLFHWLIRFMNNPQKKEVF